MTGRRIAARLWAELIAERRLFLVTVGSGLLAQLGIAAVAVGTAVIVGRAAVGVPPTAALVIGVGVGALLAGIAVWAEMYASHDLAYRVMAALRVRLFDRLRRIVPSRRQQRHSADLVTTAIADVEALEWVFAHVFGQLSVAVVMLAGAGTVLALVDPVLLVVLVPAAVLVLAVPWWRRAKVDRVAEQQRTVAARLSADVLDTVQGMAVLTSAGTLTGRLDGLARTSALVDRLAVRQSIRAGAEAAVIEAVLAGAGLIGLLGVVGAVRSGAVGPQESPVVLALFGLALTPLAGIGGALRNIGPTRSAGTRILELLDGPDTVQPAAGTGVARPEAPPLRLRSVGFGYRPDRPVLAGADLTLHRGEIVALTGDSGAGKSTLVHLLQRFFDPDTGVIEVAGVDLRELADDRLRRLVTAVSQQIDLFAGTLRDNLVLGDPTADDERVRRVVRAAQLDEVVRRIPGGLDGAVGERGATLSGGERARVALARALLPEPVLLVLDEAVAGLDAVLERDLHRALRQLPSRPAILVVAHRPSTMAACDRVVCLRAGLLQETG